MISFLGEGLSLFDSTSSMVGSGVDSLEGNSSCSSMNSPLHILSASSLGMGGYPGRTDTTAVDVLALSGIA